MGKFDDAEKLCAVLTRRIDSGSGPKYSSTCDPCGSQESHLHLQGSGLHSGEARGTTHGVRTTDKRKDLIGLSTDLMNLKEWEDFDGREFICSCRTDGS